MAFGLIGDLTTSSGCSLYRVLTLNCDVLWWFSSSSHWIVAIWRWSRLDECLVLRSCIFRMLVETLFDFALWCISLIGLLGCIYIKMNLDIEILTMLLEEWVITDIITDWLMYQNIDCFLAAHATLSIVILNHAY